jgi:phosphate-selective porin
MAIKLNKLAIAGVACSAIFAGFSSSSFADTSSVIDKLYEKGILNDEEYAELNKEAKDERREAAEKSAKDNDPNKLSGKWKDGFKFETADKQYGFQIAGRIQQDFRYFDNDGQKADTFTPRRLYFGLKGTIANDWKIELTKNFADDAVEYAFVEYAGNPGAKIRMGSQKFFYSFEEMTSSRFIDMIERSNLNPYTVQKDRGIQIHGEPVKNQFAYSVGYLNGNKKSDDGASGKDKMIRLAYNFTGDAGKKRGTIAHVDVAASQGAYESGFTIPALKTIGGKSITAINPNTATLAANGDISRNNIGGVFITGPFKLHAEHNKFKWDDGSTNSGDISGHFVTISYMLTGERYADNYSLGGMKGITPQTEYSSSTGKGGAWEIALRSEHSEMSQNVTTASNTTDKVDTIVAGLKWIPNKKTRIILNYFRNNFDDAVTSSALKSEKAWVLRTQVDF